MPLPEGDSEAATRVATQVRGVIESNYPGATVLAVESVSGKVSSELFTSGALALALAMLGSRSTSGSASNGSSAPARS
jgi:preprotein translocase subunit SecF